MVGWTEWAGWAFAHSIYTTAIVDEERLTPNAIIIKEDDDGNDSACVSISNCGALERGGQALGGQGGLKSPLLLVMSRRRKTFMQCHHQSQGGCFYTLTIQLNQCLVDQNYISCEQKYASNSSMSWFETPTKT